MNVVKHAQAKNVAVATRREGDEIRVVVEDDGKGFDISDMDFYDESRGGFGLFSIRERLACLGGRLEIESERGGGTRAVLAAPLAPRTHTERKANDDQSASGG